LWREEGAKCMGKKVTSSCHIREKERGDVTPKCHITTNGILESQESGLMSRKYSFISHNTALYAL
jgi:hypothetical protein